MNYLQVIQDFRRIPNAADGAFSGIARVEVDAAYFVSSYDTSKLGEQGVLGMLGTDGIFRVRRTGEAVTASDAVDYAAVVPDTNDTEALLSVNGWDGVRRYTSARQLYDLPLAVIVGLSEEEQLAAVTRQGDYTRKTSVVEVAFPGSVYRSIRGWLAQAGPKFVVSRQAESIYGRLRAPSAQTTASAGAAEADGWPPPLRNRRVDDH